MLLKMMKKLKQDLLDFIELSPEESLSKHEKKILRAQLQIFKILFKETQRKISKKKKI